MARVGAHLPVMPAQSSLFETDPLPSIPGLRYRDGFLTQSDEAAVVDAITDLAFRPFEFGPYTGKREVVSFGWRYDYGAHQLRQAGDIPPLLTDLKARAEAFAGLPQGSLVQALVTRYEPGAAIGWHRDRPHFAEVVGVSLLTPAPLRFRRKREGGWDRATIIAEPRSAYLLSGPARTVWEHSIPALDRLRYSITFRRLARP